MPDLRLSAYYLNTRRLNALTGANISAAAQDSLLRNSGERAQAMQSAVEVANGILKSGQIPNLSSVVAAGEPGDGSVLGVVWDLFTFRGVPYSLERERTGESAQPATFSGTIPLGDGEYELTGRLSNDHLYSSTSVQLLSGKRRAYERLVRALSILSSSENEFRTATVNSIRRSGRGFAIGTQWTYSSSQVDRMQVTEEGQRTYCNGADEIETWNSPEAKAHSGEVSLISGRAEAWRRARQAGVVLITQDTTGWSRPSPKGENGEGRNSKPSRLSRKLAARSRPMQLPPHPPASERYSSAVIRLIARKGAPCMTWVLAGTK
jgi:hypothetical protein